jgi:multimeric flavodoxin WrbA
MKKVLILDGSLHGKGGNTHGVTEELLKLLPDVEVDYIELKKISDISSLESKIRAADGFIVATGTYWQSWGSPMQRFLEEATPWEGADLWMGKPVCFVITMHSIGGMEVMSRLESNFSMFGALIPPHCSIVHSEVNQLARKDSPENLHQDIWDLRYLPTIAHNFKAALDGTHNYEPWKVDSAEEAKAVWFKKKSG